MNKQSIAKAQDKAAAQAASVASARFEKIIVKAMQSSVEAYEKTGKIELKSDFKDDLETVLIDTWGRAGRLVGERVIGQFKSGYLHLETKNETETLFTKILREFIAEFGALRVTQITDATRSAMVRIIEAGGRNGDSVAEIAKSIRSMIPIIGRYRADIIARTETHSAGQDASMKVAKSSTLKLNKEWVAVNDGRTRDFGEGDGVIDEFSHRSMNGQKVPIDKPYLVPRKDGTIEKMRYPGDINGSAGNIINCRCASVFSRAD